MTDILGTFNFLLILKGLLLLGELVYLVFALVVVRQVQLMVNTLDGNLTPVVKLISWLHLAGAVLLFVFSLVLL